MSDKNIIKNLYIELCNASINKDINALDEILSDNYILVHMTGMKQTKEDYINAIKDGNLKYYEAVHESIDIKINKDKAFVIGKTKTLASPFGISKSWWKLKQELTLEKINGKWLIISSVASTY